jgi:peptidoglycan/LPS O-acetylase OafA/YrhL
LLENNTTFKHFSGIDGLRALAVIAVMLYHLDFSSLPGGFTGVDIFFVISGFVVSYSLSQHRHESLTQFVIFFYARRVLRILPALLFCILITVILTIAFIPESWLSNSVMLSGKAAIFGLSNFVLVWQNDGYFAPQAEFNPFTHTWSLAVEEQFYFIFPAIFYFWTLSRGSLITNTFIRSQSFALLSFLSFLYCIYASLYIADQAYYFIFSRFWQLACGVMLFQVIQQKSFVDIFLKLKNWPVLLGLLCIAISLSFADKTLFPFPWGIFPVIGTVLIISHMVLVDSTNRITTLFSQPLFRWIGRLSYSMYLWHWPIYTLMRWTVGMENLPQYSIALTLTLIMSSISYYLIEVNVAKWKSIKLKPQRAILFGVIAAFSVFFVFDQALDHRTLISQSVTKNKYDWYPYTYHHGLSKQQIASEENSFVGKTLYVIGDSHAEAYNTMLKGSSLLLKFKVVNLGKGGCAILPFNVFEQSKECLDFLDESITFVEKNASPHDIVFLPSLRLSRFSHPNKNPNYDEVMDEHLKLTSGEIFQRNKEQAVVVVGRFLSKQLEVILEAPKPLLFAPAFRCSDWFNQGNSVCRKGLSISREFIEQYRLPIFDAFTEMAKQNSNVYLWDPLPLLCEPNKCKAYRDDKPIFFDADHLSAFGNRLLIPSFVSQISEIWQE